MMLAWSTKGRNRRVRREHRRQRERKDEMERVIEVEREREREWICRLPRGQFSDK